MRCRTFADTFASNPLGRILGAFSRDGSGQIAVIAGLVAVPLVMATGVAIDYSRASDAQSQLQEALDAAVIAGARDASTSWKTLAASTLTANLTSASFTLDSSAFSTDGNGTYTGNAAGSVKTTFTGLFAVATLSISATSVAANNTTTSTSTTTSTTTDAACILLLDATASPGLLLNNGATINAPNCQVHVKSTGSPAATFNTGTTLNTKKTCIAGSTKLDNGGTHPNVKMSCTTVADPFAGTLPTPASSSCTYSNYNVNGGTVTMSPGVYCGWLNLNNAPTVTFQPGVYVIKGGGVNVNGGSWSGTGVTFYFPDTSYIQFNGTVKLDLTAPTSGTYANLLMYEAAGLAKSSFTMNATNGANLQGLIYLPSRQLTLNAGASASSNNLTLVLDTLTVNQANWTLASSAKPVPVSETSTTTSTTTSSKIYLKQ